MKRNILFLVTMVVAIVASASVPFNQRPIQRQNNRVIPPTEFVQSVNMNKTRLDAGLRIPDGELKTYKRSGQYLYVKNGYLYRGFQTDKVDIIYTENNVVFIKNILCGAKNYFGDDFWVQGTINDEGTEITVPLGQSVYTSSVDGADVVLGFGSTADTSNGVSYMIDENVGQAVYAIDGERISFLGTSGFNGSNSYAATGLMAYWSDDDSWTGFIECNTVLTQGTPVAAPEVITEVPEGCQVVTYAYTGESMHANWMAGWSMSHAVSKIDVAYDEDGSVYIHNPLWRFNQCDTWVKGSFDSETGIISIPTGQYLAWSDKLGYGVQLKWGSTHVEENGMDQNNNPKYELRYTVDEYTKQICYQVDGNKLYLIGSEGDSHAAFPYNYEATSVIAVYSDNQMMEAMEYGISATELPDDVDWGVPQMPYIEYFDGDAYFIYEPAWAYIMFYLPEYDVNGNYLDPEYLSYSLYLEGDVIEFNPDDYPELSDWTTEITYDVWSQNGYFGYNFAMVYALWCDHYMIGIQAHYTVNGNKYSSDINYYYIPQITGTTELPDSKSVSSVRYYNVMGQEISAPAGLTIQVTTYTDGTTQTTKVVK